MKTNLLSFIASALLAPVAQASILKPDASVSCHVKDDGAELTSFSFDLYATGFPMAGARMYSGMFEAEAPGLSCRKVRGHIYSGVDNGNFSYRASSNCLEDRDFRVVVMTSFYEPDRLYDGQLSYRTNGPLGPSAYKTVSISCQLENRSGPANSSATVR